jgi:bacterioferritin
VTSKQILDLLSKGIALELHASMKYMWQHILVKEIEGVVVENLFRDVTIAEMKHAEGLAERLVFLNGVPPIDSSSSSVLTHLMLLQTGAYQA